MLNKIYMQIQQLNLCGCSLGCAYIATADGDSVSGWAISNDRLWPSIQINLDIAYVALIGGTYDWCSGVCTGPIIGVVIGVLAGVGIIVGIIIWRRKKAAANQAGQRLMDNQSPYAKWFHSIKSLFLEVK